MPLQKKDNGLGLGLSAQFSQNQVLGAHTSTLCSVLVAIWLARFNVCTQL
jgi:hypothetical protein